MVKIPTVEYQSLSSSWAGILVNGSRSLTKDPMGWNREAIANTLIGVVFFFVILASVFHYTGVWYAAFLPMSDAATYDNTGASYNVSRVLTPQFTLDEQAYKDYSPLFLRYV